MGKNEEKKLLQRYHNYIDSLDFSLLKTEEISFYQFKVIHTKVLMGRLQHYYDHVTFYPPREYDTESFDVLLLCRTFEKLVIMYMVPEEFKSLPQHGCTLTELKKKGYSHLIWGGSPEELPIVKDTELGQFHCFERPYELRAHTEANEDYGDIWHGDTLVHEGSKYGDTSKFLIIGYISCI